MSGFRISKFKMILSNIDGTVKMRHKISVQKNIRKKNIFSLNRSV